MKNRKGFSLPLLLIVVLLVILSVGVFFFFRNSQKNMVWNEPNFFDSEFLGVSYIKIADSGNSAPLWSKVFGSEISKTDKEFLNKYLANFSIKNLPPVSQSNDLIKKYKNLLNVFDSAKVLNSYQCSYQMGEVCNFSVIMDASNLASLRATVFLNQNKLPEAVSEAKSIINVGESISNNGDDVINLLVGWKIQRLGYQIIKGINEKGEKTYLTTEEIGNKISDLRKSHTFVLKLMYIRNSEIIDYITSENNELSNLVLFEELKEPVSIFRKEIGSGLGWDTGETKKYFYDSIKNEISNIEKPCGDEIKDSKIGIKLDQNNKQEENYVGKELYIVTYAPLGSSNVKRCEVESLINSLKN
ncbi:MAG: hypothetical protein NTV72_02875 [Candidatus Taylorbacteria bacterium]|nr:hypothetical protein [Candidatus Taylorbacteria bacterium]